MKTKLRNFHINLIFLTLHQFSTALCKDKTQIKSHIKDAKSS